MGLRRIRISLALSAVGACLPENPTLTETGTETASSSSTGDPTEGGSDGLFACASPPCTILVVSQTLDDRVDVFDVSADPYLRGRIGLDLKPDPTGAQTMGNLLDEPYGLALDATHLWVAVGHYPDINKGSLVGFPRAGFDGLAAGGVFAESAYFSGGTFQADVQGIPLDRPEAIFVVPHPSGRLLVGVFANDLRAADWPAASELLIIDPTSAEIGAFDLGTLDPAPCKGGWHVEPLNDDVSRVALACDGSESVAVLLLPGDLGALSPAEAATQTSACSLNLGGEWTTQFVAADGAGGMLALQSQLTGAPRLWSVSGDCLPAGAPGTDLPPELAMVRTLRQPVLARSGATPVWLAASGIPEPGVVIIRGGATPAICGRLTGLDALNTDNNAPWALALDASRSHLAIGAGPANNPELSKGEGQVLWGALDLAGLDACAAAASDLKDLSQESYKLGDPRTWVRAPNVLLIAELGDS